MLQRVSRYDQVDRVSLDAGPTCIARRAVVDAIVFEEIGPKTCGNPPPEFTHRAGQRLLPDTVDDMIDQLGMSELGDVDHDLPLDTEPIHKEVAEQVPAGTELELSLAVERTDMRVEVTGMCYEVVRLCL